MQGESTRLGYLPHITADAASISLILSCNYSGGKVTQSYTGETREFHGELEVEQSGKSPYTLREAPFILRFSPCSCRTCMVTYFLTFGSIWWLASIYWDQLNLL